MHANEPLWQKFCMGTIVIISKDCTKRNLQFFLFFLNYWPLLGTKKVSVPLVPKLISPATLESNRIKNFRRTLYWGFHHDAARL